MRLFLCTLAPMLTVALLVAVGGERLSRRENTERTPHDRERLLDFSEALASQLAELETLYLTRLDHLARLHGEKEEFIKSKGRETKGINLIRILRVPKKDQTITLGTPSINEPEIILTGREQAFDFKQAAKLPEDLFSRQVPEEGTWQTTPSPNFRVYYRKPGPDIAVAFLIDYQALQTIFETYIREWMTTPALPLVESRERVSVEFQDQFLFASGEARNGPAAAIIPYRTIFGNLEIRAWDGLQSTPYRDTTTLVLTTALTLFLIAAGTVLYWHQRRALRLASERVSFVNRVSHELGSPLTNLALNIDLAHESLASNPGQTRKRLAIVTEEIERLSRLVANVLTFSRQDRDSLQLHPEHVFPEKIVAEAIESFRPLFKRKNITVSERLSSLPPSLLDPDALSQIAGNLLSNVEKYAASGKWVGITLEEKNNLLHLTVTDKGPGIPAKASERIFQPFERVHQEASEGSSGTGLGLSIARDLATRMGGQLELLANDSGSTFRLSLPLEPSFSVITSDSSAA